MRVKKDEELPKYLNALAINVYRPVEYLRKNLSSRVSLNQFLSVIQPANWLSSSKVRMMILGPYLEE